MLQEISRVSFQASKIQEPLTKYQNSVIAVRVDKGIQLYEFTYNLDSLDKNIGLKSSWIQNPTSSPGLDFFPPDFLDSEINNIDMTEMILDPGLWSHNPVLLQENSMVVAMEWSPVGIVHNNQHVLAVLNNVGNIQFYGESRFGWENVFDLSSVIKQQFVTSKRLNVPKTLYGIKKHVFAVETSAIAWGPKLDESSCYFVTAQRNSDIMFWSIHHNHGVVRAQFIGTASTDCGDIVTMLWVPKSENNHIVICSNTLGEIFTYEFEFARKNIETIKTACLWKHKDKMIPKYLLHTIVEDKIILICNKHRHLIVQAMDKSYNKLAEVAKNVNDFRISDIKKSGSDFYLVTTNSKLYKVNPYFVNNKLAVSIALIETKDHYQNYDFHSVINVVPTLIAVAMVDQRLQRKKEGPKIELVFLTPEIEHRYEMQMLLNNPTRKLTNYWPYIELIRVKTAKLKMLPLADYKQLFSNDTISDLYNLKLYLIFVILYNRIDFIGRNSMRGILPETSEVVVKENIQALHASKVISALCETQQNNGVLDDLEAETLIGSQKFLETYCKKYDRQLSEFVSVGSLTNRDYEYTCQCCDEKIEGFECKSDHFNMFCAATFTPIDSDNYLVCKRCSSTYRIELYRNNAMCLYCDLYLNYITDPS